VAGRAASAATNASVPAHIQAAHRGIEFIERFTGRPIGVQLLLPLREF
jgi:hypothetical protein